MSPYTLPLSGAVVYRFGSGRTVAAMATLVAVALATVAVDYLAVVVPVVLGLFVFATALGRGVECPRRGRRAPSRPLDHALGTSAPDGSDGVSG